MMSCDVTAVVLGRVGGDNKDSECGSNTEKFIQHIKPLLPKSLCPQTEFQQVWAATFAIYHDT